MKKVQLIIFILILITLGLREYIDYRQPKPIEIVAGEKVEGQLQTGPRIHFLDIGQGDATLIDFPDGQQMLIDCAIDARILEALGRTMEFYDKTIDYLVISHPDLDHYGGCQDVLDRFEVKQIIMTGYGKAENTTWRSLLAKAEAENAERKYITEREIWNIASTTVDFLYPDHDVELNPNIPGIATKDESNNTSIIMKVSYGKNSVLLTADMGVDLEQYLLQTYKNELDVDILKVGHHGSAGSTGDSFLKVVTPRDAINSSGVGNSYGHPSRRVLKRLERTSSTIWRTDSMGDILLEFTGNDYYVREE